MPLDHFVSQVHLKRFYSPEFGMKKMHGVNKITLEKFMCGSRDICRTPEGNTNSYLKDERIVEEFLKIIEPKYNASVENVRNGSVSAEDIFTISGFAAYILTCSPTAMRLSSHWMEKAIETASESIEKLANLPPPPKSLGGTSLSDLISKGVVGIKVDKKYPQAIGITSIIKHTLVFGNSHWDVLLNDDSDSPFFTSDFPVTIEKSKDTRILNRLLPLSPDLAIRIHPKIEQPRPEDAWRFPNFSLHHHHLNKQEIRAINTDIVRCAENNIYYRDDKPWVIHFIRKHSRYWIESDISITPVETGKFFHITTKISRRE